MSPWVHRARWKSPDAIGLGFSEQEISPAVASLGQGLISSGGLTSHPGTWSSGGQLVWEAGLGHSVLLESLRALEPSQGKEREITLIAAAQKKRVQSLLPMH